MLLTRFWLLFQFLRFLIIAADKNFTVYVSGPNGESIPFIFEYGDSIDRIVERFCTNDQIENCEETADSFSNKVYGIPYTPTCFNCTLTEYTATRLDVINNISERFNYRRYLEIGCDQDNLFRHTKSKFNLAICVDPASGGTHRMTSDDFFKTNSHYFDIIFIDGLHEANQVIRDIYNSLKWLSEGGTILIHDCIPRGRPVRNSFPRADMVKNTNWIGKKYNIFERALIYIPIVVLILQAIHGKPQLQ